MGYRVLKIGLIFVLIAAVFAVILFMATLIVSYEILGIFFPISVSVVFILISILYIVWAFIALKNVKKAEQQQEELKRGLILGLGIISLFFVTFIGGVIILVGYVTTTSPSAYNDRNHFYDNGRDRWEDPIQRSSRPRPERRDDYDSGIHDTYDTYDDSRRGEPSRTRDHREYRDDRPKPPRNRPHPRDRRYP